MKLCNCTKDVWTAQKSKADVDLIQTWTADLKKHSTWSIDPADLRKILHPPPSGAEFDGNSDLPDVESEKILAAELSPP